MEKKEEKKKKKRKDFKSSCHFFFVRQSPQGDWQELKKTTVEYSAIYLSILRPNLMPCREAGGGGQGGAARLGDGLCNRWNPSGVS